MASNSVQTRTGTKHLRQLLRDVARAVALAGPDHPMVQSIRQSLSLPGPPEGYDGSQFPWAPLGLAWARLAGQRTGSTRQQLLFASHWASVGNGAAAARFAQYQRHAKQAAHVA